jgi:PAS domain S-box-containing protein
MHAGAFSRPRARLAAEIGLLALLYFIAARLGQLLATVPGNVTPVWIPSGIILAAVLIRGRRVWPGIFLGAFAGSIWAHLATDSAGTLVQCLLAGTVNGVGDTLCAVGGAALITWTIQGRDPLGRALDALQFVTIGAILGGGVSAVFRVTGLCLAGFVHWHDYGGLLVTSWTSDAVGVLLLAPILLVMHDDSRVFRPGWRELLFLLAVPLVSLGGMRLLPQVPGFFTLPMLLWAAVRFDRRVVFIAIPTVAAVTLLVEVLGESSVAVTAPNGRLVFVQLYLTLLSVPIYVLCGALAEQKKGWNLLQDFNRDLDTRVKAGVQRLEEELVERGRAEAQARDSARLLQTVIDDSPLLVYAKDLDGRFILASRSLAEFFGQSSHEQVLGKTSHDFLPTEVADAHRANDLAAMARKSLIRAEEFAHLGNGPQTFLSAKFPLFDAEGRVVAVCGASADITERKRMEEELERTARELKQSNEEIERFLYTASHDLKSPVVTLQMFLLYLDRHIAAADAAGVAKDLDFIRGAVAKMAMLLDDLLLFARVGRVTAPLAPVPFRTLADSALETLAGSIAERDVVVQVSAADVVLHCNAISLGQIWQNLVENACKFSRDQESPRVEIGVEEHDGEPVFFVRDNGIGIDPRFQSKVFLLFEKLDARSPGTGVGLAIVKRIVDLHHGRLWVESAGTGQGACFRFTLPDAVRQGTYTNA